MNNFKEILLCLLSPKHAADTELRIHVDTELKILRWGERALFVVLGAVISMAVFCIYQYNFYKDMRIVKYNNVTVYTKPN